MEKPRFSDSFVENEVFSLLKHAAVQRVFLFYVENAGKMICKIRDFFVAHNRKWDTYFRKSQSELSFKFCGSVIIKCFMLPLIVKEFYVI